MQGIDVFDMRPLDASRRGTGLASPTTMAFVIVDEITLIGTTLCECGVKTWRGCVGGGWCWFYRTWRKEGTKTERELREWKFRVMVANELEKSEKGWGC